MAYFAPESPAGLPRNRWPLSIGISGRFGPEYAQYRLSRTNASVIRCRRAKCSIRPTRYRRGSGRGRTWTTAARLRHGGGEGRGGRGVKRRRIATRPSPRIGSAAVPPLLLSVRRARGGAGAGKRVLLYTEDSPRAYWSPSRVKDRMRLRRSPLLRDNSLSSRPGDRLVMTDLPIRYRPALDVSADSVLSPQCETPRESL